MNEWNIQSRAHACQACEKGFADKESYHTLLFSERTEFSRKDICRPCWESRYGLGLPDDKGYISHWQGVYHAPPAAPVDPIQKETAETLLRKLIELNDPKYGPACFILAVMLERKRLLKVKEQLKRDGKRVFIYEHPKNGDLFTITDPDLQLNQLDEVQRTVADLLEHGLQSQPATPASPDAPADSGASPQEPTPEQSQAEPANINPENSASSTEPPQVEQDSNTASAPIPAEELCAPETSDPIPPSTDSLPPENKSTVN